MSAKININTTFDNYGRLASLKIGQATFYYIYDSTTGILQSIYATGSRANIKAAQSYIDIINRKFIDQILNIRNIENIEVIEDINNIAYIANIALLDRLSLLDRITLIDEIDIINTITSIGSIDNLDKLKGVDVATVTPNLVKNGDFISGTLDYWNISAGATIYYDVGIAKNVCKLTANATVNYIESPYPSGIIGTQLKIMVLAKGGSVGASVTVSIYYTDATFESVTNGLASFAYYPTYFTGTAKKTVATVLISGDTTKDVYVSNVQATSILEDALGDLAVLPKAKGKTPVNLAIGAQNAVVTLYTVPVGYNFWMEAAWVSGIAVAASVPLNNGTVRKSTGEIIIACTVCTSTAVDRMTSQNSISPTPPLSYPAGTVFETVSSNANVYVLGGIMGWIELA
jgi:hypothetical protein